MFSKYRNVIAVVCGLSLIYVLLVLTGFSPLDTGPGRELYSKGADDRDPSDTSRSNTASTSHSSNSKGLRSATSSKPSIVTTSRLPLATSGAHSTPTAPSITTPSSLPPNQLVAIVVPYRDREIHLKIFTHYMTTFLQQQNSTARIYIVEQAGTGRFNRAKLFNVGYVEAKKDAPFNCFIFHDIDLIPENRKLPYKCSMHPKHMSAAIDKFSYTLPYNSIFGGVSALSEKHMKDTNGFSNLFWGWGGEDDDMYTRVTTKDKLVRPPMTLARYTMLQNTGKHVRSKENPERFNLLRNVRARMPTDGVSTLQYRLIQKKNMRTYTLVLADLLESTNGKTIATPTPTPAPTPKQAVKEKTLVTTTMPTIISKTKSKTVNDSKECLALQKMRHDKINAVCKDRLGKYPNTDLKVWRSRPNVIILEKERAIFCFITNSGAIEWKNKILAHRGVTRDGQYNGTDLIEPDIAIQRTLQKYQAKLLNSYTDEQQTTMLKDFYKFAFFTNPYQRIYESYLEKLTNMNNENYRPMAEKILKDLNVKNRTIPTFTHFLQAMPGVGYGDLHWMRYGDLCSPCQVGYDFIGKMETLAADTACLLPHLQMSSWFPVLPAAAQRKAAAKVAEIYSGLPKELLQKVEQAYGLDAWQFDYSLPGAKKS